MFIPVGAENEDVQTPLVTYCLIAMCVAVYLYQAFGPWGTHDILWESFSFQPLALIPNYDALSHARKITGAMGMMLNPFKPAWLQAITSVFLHGSLWQLVSNMAFLWVFGPNIEHLMGRVRFLAFVLLMAFLAQFTDVLFGGVTGGQHTNSSAAIGGILGAYMMYYAHTHMRVYIFGNLRFSGREVRLRAYYLLLLHIASQYVGTIMDVHADPVQFWALMGGYAFGYALARLFRDPAVILREEAERLFGSDAVPEEKNDDALSDFSLLENKPLMNAKHNIRPALSDMREKGRAEARLRKERGLDWAKKDK
ncbi:MAG: rhomboid family intramembrane serine protease [Micavibrio sp.]|nr:rhomboid family intramembrane serine protease [Micavibrio sp.]